MSGTGEIRRAELFAAVLGASSYTFAEAVWTQSLPDWIAAHVNMLAFIGGVPRQIVSDNLRAGITRACFYEPLVNRCAYQLCHPNVLMMEAAEPTDRCDTPGCLRWSVERKILVQRKMRADTIVVGQVIGQQLAQMPFAKHHDMVEALASDRSD